MGLALFGPCVRQKDFHCEENCRLNGDRCTLGFGCHACWCVLILKRGFSKEQSSKNFEGNPQQRQLGNRTWLYERIPYLKWGRFCRWERSNLAIFPCICTGKDPPPSASLCLSWHGEAAMHWMTILCSVVREISPHYGGAAAPLGKWRNLPLPAGFTKKVASAGGMAEWKGAPPFLPARLACFDSCCYITLFAIERDHVEEIRRALSCSLMAGMKRVELCGIDGRAYGSCTWR